MTRYLLDTCAVSEFAKREPNLGFVGWAAEVDPARTYLSVITIGELYYGIALLPESRRARLESWLARDVLAEFGSRILAFDHGIAEQWGALRAAARHGGVTLPALDAAIAATAARHELTVVTRNTNDFSHANVPTFNPWD